LKQTRRRFVGIDLGKRTYELKIINPNEKVTGWNGKTTIQERNKLYAKLQSNDRVAMDVCTLAFIMASEMEKKVHCEVRILNAGQLPIIYHSTKKNDKEDALKLARLMKTHENEELLIISLPSEKEIRRRKLLAEYRQLKQHRTKELNRLHAVFVSAGYTEIVKKILQLQPAVVEQ
jgi:transposase